MSAPPIPLAAPPAGPLHARRCVRHPAREAAARCPGCGEFFCRECVVEHGGKLLCAACVARATAKKERSGPRFAPVRQALGTAAAVAVLWLVFYLVGDALLKTPPDFHDGTVWKKIVERSGP